MKRILTLTAALLLSACTTPSDCRQSLYGCNEGRAVASEAARPATPTKQEKPTERPGPIKPDTPTKPEKPDHPGKPGHGHHGPKGDKPGHGHGDKNHGHSGPRGHGKNGGRK